MRAVHPDAAAALEDYRAMVETWPDPAAILDLRQRLVLANRALRTWLGYNQPAALIAQPAALLTPAEDRGALNDYTEAVLGSPTGLPPLEQRFRHNDGRVLIGRMTGQPITLDHARAALLVIHPTGLTAYTHDRLELLESALDHVNDSVVILERERRDVRGLRCVFVNRAFVQWTGMRSDQIVGSPIKLHDGTDLDEVGCKRLDAALIDSREVHMRYGRRRRDGRERVVELTLSPILGEGGQHTHWLAMERDVSEQREEQVRMLESERANSLATIAAGIAHGINNPLAYVSPNIAIASDAITAVAGASEGISEEFRARLLEALTLLLDARDGASRIRAIVQDMRLLAQSTDANLVPTDVRRVLEASISMVSSFIRPRAELVCDYEEVPRVLANDGRLGQIFVNLLLNAAQALPTKDITRRHRIAVSVRNHGRASVRIDIHDTGAGIPPAIRDRVFAPFFSTKPPTIGTGLGLSICHRIVNALGGSIEFESEVDRGTTFHVTLPAMPGSMTEKDDAPPADDLSPVARILVIDDEAPVAAALCRMLGPRHHIVTANGGRQALEILRLDSDFDAIFCDVNMPDASGIDVYQVIAARDPKLAGRFVFVTGGVFTPDAQEFLDAVPNACLEKPFDKGAVIAAVKLLADGRRS